MNNAGFLRDRMIFNMSEADFDDVVRVHVKGHFCTARHASVHWRAASKAADGPVYARIINTASEAMLLGSPGQPNYASAKAAIVNLTLVIANSLGRLGVNANAIAPRARTRMTEELGGFAAQEVVDGYDPLGAEHVAALVAYLASPAAARISGQLFVVYGRTISVVHGPFIEQSFDVDPDVGPGVWTLESVSEQLTPFYETREPVIQGFTIQGDPRA